MNIVILIFVIAFICILGIKIKKGQNKKNIEIDNEDSCIENNNEMEKLFFAEVRNGEKKYRFTHALDEYDFMYIKTLFHEERIPYYIEEDITLNIWPQRKIGTYGNINLYILEKHYDVAIKLIDKNRKVKV
jgi:hypothetical protein